MGLICVHGTNVHDESVIRGPRDFDVQTVLWLGESTFDSLAGDRQRGDARG